ncbi:uncharacterized protein LOC111398651 [Olea europaea var. sylvestris]|uniref:Hydroxyproline-rich glycoprotein family protein n=1 Tax=Olea europaea subsp. europaea TaxID=158383 RepID=A0A8S0UU39_OLEEU|nr:uncharacterized protein LOC111398651 [Olea europaea var. sylvestris]CAA3021471.1 Hypothetical predicted protein [Olea europaea subsp. europaea]
MRGKSSSKQISTKNGGLNLENLENMKENQETHLSGSYIRTLVKQLTSSRTKENKNSDAEFSSSSNQNSAKNGEGFSEKPKKQVRRRLHTSRPYQERLLNMAEARREIVTALKFHRAAMKKAQEMENQPLMESSSQEICLENEAKLKSRRNPRIYPSNSTSNFSYCSSAPDYSWPVSPIPPPTLQPIFQGNLNFPLPNQTLGLNLNFQDFNNLDTTPYYNPTTPLSLFSPSSASSSSSPPFSAAVATAETPCMAAVVAESGLSEMDLDLHPAMDDKEMAEIRSIGEQHQMEWNDTMNLVNSAWWFKFLKAMEISPEEKTEDYGLFSPFGEVMEFPAWLNANESCLSDYHFDDYLQDPALPW